MNLATGKHSEDKKTNFSRRRRRSRHNPTRVSNAGMEEWSLYGLTLHASFRDSNMEWLFQQEAPVNQTWLLCHSRLNWVSMQRFFSCEHLLLWDGVTIRPAHLHSDRINRLPIWIKVWIRSVRRDGSTCGRWGSRRSEGDGEGWL